MAQLMTTTVGPLASADTDGISEASVPGGAQYLSLDGILTAATFSTTSICAAQQPSGAGALTINGSRAQTNNPAGAGGTYQTAPSAYVAFLTPQRVIITCVGDESDRTFTVTGTLQSPNTFGPGTVVSESLTGHTASGRVATTNLFSTVTSVTISGAADANVTVGNGGIAVMDEPRRVDITSGGDDTGITFTITGTDWNGDTISEVLAGADTAAATSVLSYATVTSVRTSAAAAGSVQVGSSAVADSQWLYFDRLAANAQVALQVDGEGTVNWTVSQSLNDPTVPEPGSNLPTQTFIWPPASINWVVHPDSALVASSVTTGVQGNYAYTPALCKITLNSGTGSVRLTAIQSFLQ